MRKKVTYLAILFTAVLTSCNPTSKIIIPTSSVLPSVEDNYSILWVGSGESFVFIDGAYQRSESNDYSFEVVQRRYGNSWKSVKNMHRIHPNYDGKSGEREQTMFFGIDFLKKEDKIVSIIRVH